MFLVSYVQDDIIKLITQDTLTMDNIQTLHLLIGKYSPINTAPNALFANYVQLESTHFVGE